MAILMANAVMLSNFLTHGEFCGPDALEELQQERLRGSFFSIANSLMVRKLSSVVGGN